jgi:hypothetical protein
MFTATLLTAITLVSQAPCCSEGKQETAQVEVQESVKPSASGANEALYSIRTGGTVRLGQRLQVGKMIVGQHDVVSFGPSLEGQDGKRRTRRLILDGADLEDADLEALFEEVGGQMPMILSKIGYAGGEEDEDEGEHGYLGVQIGEADGHGVRIGGVYGSSGAARAGLRAGDVIRRVGKQKIQSIEDLTGFVGGREVGSEVRVRIERGDGWFKDTTIELVSRRDLGDIEGEVAERQETTHARRLPFFAGGGDDDGPGRRERQMRFEIFAPEGGEEDEMEVHVLRICVGEDGFDIDLEDLAGLEGLGIDLDEMDGKIEIHVEVEDNEGGRRVEKRVILLGDGAQEALHGESHRGDRQGGRDRGKRAEGRNFSGALLRRAREAIGRLGRDRPGEGPWNREAGPEHRGGDRREEGRHGDPSTGAPSVRMYWMPGGGEFGGSWKGDEGPGGECDCPQGCSLSGDRAAPRGFDMMFRGGPQHEMDGPHPAHGKDHGGPRTVFRGGPQHEMDGPHAAHGKDHGGPRMVFFGAPQHEMDGPHPAHGKDHGGPRRGAGFERGEPGNKRGEELEHHAREFMDQAREHMGDFRHELEEHLQDLHKEMRHHARELEGRVEELHQRLRELHKRFEER